jgi:glyoxylase-like metal-dependent hydrolase (beta-lactamase superfamily II)
METLLGSEPRFKGGLRKVEDGVYAWLQPNGSWGESNAALIVGDGESLLVDTLWTPPLTERMLEAMKRHTARAPITRVVNTHADGDHWWGNQNLAGVEIVATAAAAQEMEELSPEAVTKLQGAADTLGLSDRLPLRIPGRSQVSGLSRLVRDMLGAYDFSGIELTPPTRTFSGTLELDVGGRRVEVIEVGPAHTFGDAIVHVPDVNVVVAADILFIGVTPVMWAGPVDNWIAAIDRILALEPSAIVPGHGPLTNPKGVERLRDYWRYVDAAARRRFAAGESARAAAAAMLGSEEFQSKPFATWDNPERLAINMHTIRRGQPKPVSGPQRLRVMADAGSLS